MEKGQFVPSQEQIAKELIDIKDGEDISSKRQFVALQEQAAKELCGVYHGNHINKEKRQFVVSQEQVAKELGVDVRTLQRLKKLNSLSSDLQELISDGTVKYTTALNIWGKLTNEDKSKLIEELGKDKIKEIKAKESIK